MQRINFRFMLPEELKAQKFVDMGGENILDFLGLNRGHGALNGAKCQKSIWKEGNQWKKKKIFNEYFIYSFVWELNREEWNGYERMFIPFHSLLSISPKMGGTQVKHLFYPYFEIDK